MAQIVIEFGAPALNPVFEALMALIGPPTAVDLWLKSEGRATCPTTKEAIKEIPRRFTDGEISAVTFRSEIPEIRYNLILAPHFYDHARSFWMGAIELTTPDWQPYWNRLLQFEGLTFVCVGEE